MSALAIAADLLQAQQTTQRMLHMRSHMRRQKAGVVPPRVFAQLDYALAMQSLVASTCATRLTGIEPANDYATAPVDPEPQLA